VLFAEFAVEFIEGHSRIAVGDIVEGGLDGSDIVLEILCFRVRRSPLVERASSGVRSAPPLLSFSPRKA
jgi:hypothetical protein